MKITSETRLPVRRSGVLVFPFAAMVLMATMGQAISGQVSSEEKAASQRYAAIEIGSKGVKALVLDVSPSGAKSVLETVSNTTLAQDVAKSGVFSAGAIRDTAEEAGKFATRIREEFQVPAARVCVYGSSGLPKASNRDDLVKAVAESTSLPAMSFITPTEEVAATIRGSLVGEADRAQGLMVDIGSGNTKGGFLTPSGVVDFSVPLGSVTFENRVSQDAKSKKQTFQETATELRPTILEAEIAKQVALHPEMTSRGVVYFSGGAIYAMISLMKPQSVREQRVEFTAKDIADYVQFVRASPPKMPALEGITDEAIHAAAEKEIKNVSDIFTQTNRIAGAEILSALSSTLNLDNKTLRFDRSSLFAVSRGKLIEFANKDRKPSGNTAATSDGPPSTVVETRKPAVYPSPQSPQQ